AKIGGAAMTWHFRFGFVILSLLAFRLVWGLVGGRWSRFASFVFEPGTVVRYLRGAAREGEQLDVGHSPLGSFSVFALLGIVAVQVGTGLFADDEIANIGPLNRFVTTDTGLSLTSWHKTAGQWTLLTLVALHVAAILYYLWVKKTDLVGPMLSGDKSLAAATPASTDTWGTRLLALGLGGACIALAGWVWKLGG
ncbi:MAG: cytochrome b/b6 domain-containing protein, partial [Chitinophagaceae bacterium]|nr:cytochrome b/b6 domain-containing protein [Rubrivivax sp.]